MRMHKTITITALILIAIIAMQTSATADLYIQYSESYTTESTDPSFNATATNPWLTALFQDDHSYGDGVLLTLRAPKLTGSEYVANWFFNLREELDVEQLAFQHVAGLAPDVNDRWDWTRENGFHQTGKNTPMEIWIPFLSSNSPHKKGRFISDEYSQILISGIEGLVAQDFNRSIFATEKLWVSVAHVRSTPNGGSAWVRGDDPPPPSVPEPSTWMLLGIGLLAMPFTRLIRR